MTPFCQGQPGAMVMALMPLAAMNSWTVSAMDSEPLSDRMFSGWASSRIMVR